MFKINTKKLPKSEIEIEGEIDASVFENYFNKALKKLGENVKLNGFRQGKIPENILLANIPEIKILEEMAEMALNEYYPKIIESEGLDVINHPEISITKLARKNPLGFKIKTVILPEIILPSYKDLAKEILSSISLKDKEINITEEEIENTILDIRKSRAPKVQMAEIDASPISPMSDIGEDIGENKAAEIPPLLPEFNDLETSDVSKSEVPPFDDEFVQGLGPFENIADFKEKLKENIKLEKENQNKEKTRLKIVEKILENTEIEIPEILIEIELDKILQKMRSDIEIMGLLFDDYLKQLKKSKEDLKKEFRGDAEKRAKLGLVLNKISIVENIIADEKEVEKEVEYILKSYKDADKKRAQIYAQNILTNEKIFQFLESQ